MAALRPARPACRGCPACPLWFGVLLCAALACAAPAERGPGGRLTGPRYDLVAVEDGARLENAQRQLNVKTLISVLEQLQEPTHLQAVLQQQQQQRQQLHEHIGPVPFPSSCVTGIGQMLLAAGRGETWALQSEFGRGLVRGEG